MAARRRKGRTLLAREGYFEFSLTAFESDVGFEKNHPLTFRQALEYIRRNLHTTVNINTALDGYKTPERM